MKDVTMLHSSLYDSEELPLGLNPNMSAGPAIIDTLSYRRSLRLNQPKYQCPTPAFISHVATPSVLQKDTSKAWSKDNIPARPKPPIPAQFFIHLGPAWRFMPKETIRAHIIQRFAVYEKYIATYRAWEDEHNKWARHVYQLMRTIMKAQRDTVAQRDPNLMDTDLGEEERLDENDADTVGTVLDEFMEEYTSWVATEFESADLEMFDENSSALTTLQEGAEVDEHERVRRWFMSQFKRMENPGMSSRIGLPSLHRAAPRGAFGLSPEGNQSLGQTWRTPFFDLPKQAARDVLIHSAHNAWPSFHALSFKPGTSKGRSEHPASRNPTERNEEKDEEDHPWRIYSTKCSCGYANCNCRSWKSWWDETHDMLAHVEHVDVPVTSSPENSPGSVSRFVHLCSKVGPPDSELSPPHEQPALGNNPQTGQNGWVYDRFSQTGVQTETHSEHAKVPNLQYRKQHVMVASARPQPSQENIAMQLSWNNVLCQGNGASTPDNSSYKTTPQPSYHTSIKLSWEEFVGNDPSLPSEYSSEILRVLKDELEPACSLDQTILAKAINWRARTRFVYWIASIHCGYNLSPQILFLSVNLMDRFLAKKDPTPCGSQWNVLGAACLWSAWKFEGSGSALIDAAHVLKYTEPGTVSKAQIIAAEWDLHRQLNHNLSFPGPLVFMRHALTRTRFTKEVAYLARFFLEISLTLELMIPYRPSDIATAAVCLAQELMCISSWGHDSTCQEVHQSLNQIVSAILRMPRVVKDLSDCTIFRKWTHPTVSNLAHWCQDVFGAIWSNPEGVDFRHDLPRLREFIQSGIILPLRIHPGPQPQSPLFEV